MRDRAITLNDIAKKLNVSTVTVSKALRNHPDISITTTKEIHLAHYFTKTIFIPLLQKKMREFIQMH